MNKEEDKDLMIIGGILLISFGLFAICAVFNVETLGIVCALSSGFSFIWLMVCAYWRDKHPGSDTKGNLFASFFIAAIIVVVLCCSVPLVRLLSFIFIL